MSPIERYDQNGFTLMEIMVAMLILALSLTVVLQLFSGGLRSGQLSKNYLRGVYHARAIMEETLLGEPLLEEEQQGVIAEGFTWSTTVQQLENDLTAGTLSEITLFTVIVTVSWQEGAHEKSFTLQSQRLGPILEEGAP